jgi:hypothetical protein
MPTIRIDDEVYEFLARNAKPFVDTPNDVLHRLLLLDARPAQDGAVPTIVKEPDVVRGVVTTVNKTTPAKSVRQRRPRVPDANPKQIYWKPILEILNASGEGVTVQIILDSLQNMVQLLPGDWRSINTGEIRWKNRAKWAAKDMALDGLLIQGSPKGTWRITDKGRLWLAGDQHQ